MKDSSLDEGILQPYMNVAYIGEEGDYTSNKTINIFMGNRIKRMLLHYEHKGRGKL